MLAFLWALLFTLQSAQAAKPTWDISLIIDQSPSMRRLDADSNDPGGYALIAPAIIADLSEATDSVWVYPQPPTQHLPFRMQGHARMAFKTQLEQINRSGDSDWMGALSAASQRIQASNASHDRRLVVQVYDGDDPGTQPRTLADPILAQGVDGFVIGVGDMSKLRHPSQRAVMEMFGASRALPVPKGDGQALMAAFSNIFGYILNSKPRMGSASPNHIRVQVSPAVTDAWLVVLGDQPISGLAQQGSSPGSNDVRIDANTGWTHPNKGTGYQILHLVDPQPGSWTFSANTSSGSVDWVLLETFNYGDLKVTAKNCDVGVKCFVSATVVGPALPSDVSVTATLPNGEQVTFQRQGDGSYETEVVFKTPGLQWLDVIAQNPTFKRQRREMVNVNSVSGHLICDTFTDSSAPAGALFTLGIKRQTAEFPLTAAWATVNGGTKTPLLEVQPTLYEGQLKLPEQMGPVTVVVASEYVGSVSECRATYDLRPTVALNTTAASMVEVGPSTLSSWFPYSTCAPADPDREKLRDPEQRCVMDCETCTGAVGALSLAGTQVSPALRVPARLTLKTEPPPGIQVVLNRGDPEETRFRVDKAQAVMLDPNSPELPVAICAQRCPKGGALELEFLIEVPNVFTPGGPTPTTLSQSLLLPVRVEASSFWTCQGWKVVTALLILLFLIFVWGFIRPLKFGKTSNFPTYIWTTNFGRMGQMTAGQTQQKITRRVKRTWYRPNQRIWVDLQGNLKRTASGAHIRIELRREDGRNRAWIVPVAGQHLMHAKYHPGQDAAGHAAHWAFDALVGPQGAPLELGHVYVSLASTEPAAPNTRAWCLLFKQE